MRKVHVGALLWASFCLLWDIIQFNKVRVEPGTLNHLRELDAQLTILTAYVAGPGSSSVPVLCLFSFFTGAGSASAFTAAIKTGEHTNTISRMVSNV